MASVADSAILVESVATNPTITTTMDAKAVIPASPLSPITLPALPGPIKPPSVAADTPENRRCKPPAIDPDPTAHPEPSTQTSPHAATDHPTPVPSQQSDEPSSPNHPNSSPPPRSPCSFPESQLPEPNPRTPVNPRRNSPNPTAQRHHISPSSRPISPFTANSARRSHTRSIDPINADGPPRIRACKNSNTQSRSVPDNPIPSPI